MSASTVAALALRQDALRWLRKRHADVYVDLLVEAHADFRAGRKMEKSRRLPTLPQQFMDHHLCRVLQCRQIAIMAMLVIAACPIAVDILGAGGANFRWIAAHAIRITVSRAIPASIPDLNLLL